MKHSHVATVLVSAFIVEQIVANCKLAHIDFKIADCSPHTDMIVEGLDYKLLENNNLLPTLSGWRKACAAHIGGQDRW